MAQIILCVAPFLFGLLALWLGQDANWDLRNYHWYNAFAYLNGGYERDLLPSQTPFFYNPTLDVPYYLLATHVPAMLAGFILASVQGLNFVLLFMLAHAVLLIHNPRQKIWVCTLLAALGMLGGGGIAQLGTVFYDNITSLGIFASALLVITRLPRLLNDPWQMALRLSFIAGLPAGIMMGLKLPSVIFCVGLCGALLFLSSKVTRRLLIAFGFGCGILLGVGISLGHWAFYLQTHFGSPLFPYFNQFFQSPLAPLTSARDIQFVPQNAKDFLLFPYIFADNPLRVGEVPWHDWRLPILYTMLPVALLLRLLFGRHNVITDRVAVQLPARYLLAMAVISYLVWLGMFAIYRYAVPLEMLAPLLLVMTIGMLPFKLSTRGMLAGFTLLVVAISVQPAGWGRTKHWLPHAVEIDRPALPDDNKIMILMAGFEPFSHIISEFPPHIAFTRIQSNFASPNENKGINRLLHERVDAHRAKGGIFKLIIPPWQHPLAAEALKFYKLTIKPQTCQIIDDHLYDKLDLCDLEQATSSPTGKP